MKISICVKQKRNLRRRGSLSIGGKEIRTFSPAEIDVKIGGLEYNHAFIDEMDHSKKDIEDYLRFAKIRNREPKIIFYPRPVTV